MSSVSLNVRIKLAGLLMPAEAFPRKVTLSVPQLGGVLTPLPAGDPILATRG